MQCQAASSDLGDKMFVAMSQVRARFSCSKVGVRGAGSVAHSAIGGTLQQGLHHLQERAMLLSAPQQSWDGDWFPAICLLIRPAVLSSSARCAVQHQMWQVKVPLLKPCPASRTLCSGTDCGD